ncbi:MAG: protein arginine kinase [Mariniblastus sp.]|nr:protein arginine kinase [Mariniblastus sp.]
MILDDMAGRCGEWLKGCGPESDIVMSSRIRLARNLADYPFIRRCTDIDRANIESTVRERLTNKTELQDLTFIDVADLQTLDRQFLVERQLISREHANSDGARAVAIDQQERLSLMVNEEDHLRIQVMKSGLDLAGAWDQINDLDDRIESQLTYAFNSKLGYLTACPTNVGTGMRVSVLVHLPALVITQQIEKVFRSLQKINLVVRGLYGEGTQAMGDFYQVSNQITLGKSENDLIDQVGDVIPVVIDYERKARDFLINEKQNDLFEQVSRAYGTLQNAQQISSEETMFLLSRVRMGINLGLIGDLEIPEVNQLFIRTQPAHLQKLRHSELDTDERNIERANYLHSQLKLDGGSESAKN